MVPLHFKNTSEFESVFKVKNKHVTDAIVLGIEKAMSGNLTSARLFTVTFDDIDMAYEIALPQKEWQVALEACLDYYHSIDDGDPELQDKQIDTWKLIELVKVW